METISLVEWALSYLTSGMLPTDLVSTSLSYLDTDGTLKHLEWGNTNSGRDILCRFVASP